MTSIVPDVEQARKERRKAYCKAYREANKERRKDWYLANKSRVRKAERELRMFLREEAQSVNTTSNPIKDI